MRRVIVGITDTTVTGFLFLAVVALGAQIGGLFTPELRDESSLAIIGRLVLLPAEVLRVWFDTNAAPLGLDTTGYPLWMVLGFCIAAMLALKAGLVFAAPLAWQNTGNNLRIRYLWSPAKVDSYVTLRTGPTYAGAVRLRVMARHLSQCLKLLITGVGVGLATWAIVALLNAGVPAGLGTVLTVFVAVLVLFAFITVASETPDVITAEDELKGTGTSHTDGASASRPVRPSPSASRRPIRVFSIVPYFFLPGLAAAAFAAYAISVPYLPDRLTNRSAVTTAFTLYITSMLFLTGILMVRDYSAPRPSRLRYQGGRRPNPARRSHYRWVIRSGERFEVSLGPVQGTSQRAAVGGVLKVASLKAPVAVKWTLKLDHLPFAHGVLDTAGTAWLETRHDHQVYDGEVYQSPVMDIAASSLHIGGLNGILGAETRNAQLHLTVDRVDDLEALALVEWERPSILQWLPTPQT